MKKVLVIVGAVVVGIAVLAAAIVGLVFWATGGAVEAGEEFLALIGQEKIEEAYQSTATAFRSQQDAASFASTVRAIGLTRYESASWAQRQIQNDRATLEGSVRTVDGGTIPLTIELVSEGDAWRVLSLTTPMAGAAIGDAEKATAAAPADTAPTPGTPTPGEEATPAATAEAGAFTVVENPELAGRLGRVIVAFPEGSSPSTTRIEVRPAGGKDSRASAYGGITADLLPGAYDVVISDVVVPGAEVRSRHDTKIAVGVLRVSAGSTTRIQVFRGQQAVASGYGKGQFGLPAGAYEVEISGQREPITIAAGGIIDF